MQVRSESEVAQSCPTFSDPVDCTPPGSSIRGIFQARVLEWRAIAFSVATAEFSKLAGILSAALSQHHLLGGTSTEKAVAPTPVLLPGKSHGQRSLAGCGPWGREELDMISLSLSCIGEGNGNPLQCSCLENPKDGGAWWAAVYGVAESNTTEAT